MNRGVGRRHSFDRGDRGIISAIVVEAARRDRDAAIIDPDQSARRGVHRQRAHPR
jgi:hypothetical protein